MRPTKTLISLRIRPVKSEPLLSARRNFASLAIQDAPSEDSDQLRECAADLNLRWAQISEGTFSVVEVQMNLAAVQQFIIRRSKGTRMCDQVNSHKTKAMLLDDP